MIAGSIQLQGLPFTNPKRATERRNTVLQAMASEEYITADAATSASREPLQIVPRAVDNESPYFVDMVVQQVEAAYPGLMAQSAEINVFTPLERDVLEYADAMTQTPPAVTDELSARLLAALGAAGLVELTAFIAAANMAAHNNVALGIESQGFATSCELDPHATSVRALPSPS